MLTALAFSQRPGRMFGDTKLDLVINPAGLLARSLHLWDPQGSFGQVQNQGYGYLFPMGPFFWIGHLLTLPGWVTQRLWWSLLLSVAFLGVVKLCAVLGLGSPTTRILAGFAFALSPRILTVLGPISVEAWPSALAPWVLVPLVVGATRGSPRRAALLSATVVAMVGGVNAAATFAVVPLAAVWLLTREPGPRRRSMVLWWPVFVLAGTAWWIGPLLLLGRTSPPFLDYIETARVTTFPTTLFDTLRGTSHWVPYVDSTWQAGNFLLTTGYVALNTGALLAFGVAGLVLRRNPHRQFLVLSVLVGVLMVMAGHGGNLAGWDTGSVRAALDGVLAPLRNVHKFDPVLRIPLVLGLAHVLAVLGERARQSAERLGERSSEARGDRLAHGSVLLLCIASVVGIAGPALAGRLGTTNDFESVPGYWQRTAIWLQQHGDDSTALLVPGSSFGYYLWGDTDDEPLQPLARSPWAVRNAIPLAPAGNIRMLDGLEDRLASGRPSAGLAPYLARAGIGHLVVRNDLRDSDHTPSVVVHQALDGSPGIHRVATFGPEVGSPARRGTKRHPVIVDGGLTDRYPAVEIYAVDGARRAVGATGAPLVVGGPENLLDLLDTGLIGPAPAVLAADAPRDVDHSDMVLTDGLRRQERDFARILDATSPTLEEGDEGRRHAPARDYTIGSSRWWTHAKILGARDVTASSSQAFADSSGPVLSERLPFSAFDGLASTRWESDPRDRTPWLQLTLDAPRDLRSVRVTVADTGRARPVTVRVVTDHGSSAPVSATPGEPATVRLPPGATATVRVVRDRTSADPFAIAEVTVPGVDVDRTLVLPEVPARWGAPASILLSSTPGWRQACVAVEGDERCLPGRARDGEEPGALDRTLRLGTGAAYQVRAQVVPTDGQALQGLVQRDQLVNVRSSSDAVDDPRGSAVAAVDGDSGTTWIADADDDHPALTLNWVGARTLRGIHLGLDRDAAASRVTKVVLVYPGGRRTVRLDSTGRADFAPFRATQVDLYLTSDAPTRALAGSGSRKALPVGVSELGLPGLGRLPIRLSDIATDTGCQFGPTVRVGSGLYPTTVTASPRQLFDADLLPARLCGPATVDVPSGDTRVVISPAPAFRGLRLTMTRAVGTSVTVTPAAVADRSPVSRVLTLPTPDSRIVAVRENQNPGWVASTGVTGTATGVTVDGWQQGWTLRGGVDRLDLRFAPDRLYRAALGVGAILMLLVLGLALSRRWHGSTAPPPARPRTVPSLVVAALGLLAYGLVGGWWAFAVAGAATTVTALVRDRWVDRDVLAWIAGALVGATALGYYWRPLGSPDGWAGTLVAPQLLAFAGLGVLVGLAVGPGRSKIRFQRIAGRSTKR